MNDADALYKLFLALVIAATTVTTPMPSPMPSPPASQTSTPPPSEPPNQPPAIQPSILGVEFHAGFSNIAAEAVNLNAAWIRLNGLLWADVEPQEGQRNWSAMAALEQDILAATSRGAQVVLIVRRTPAWAQRIDGRPCSAPKPEKLDAFAAFLRDAVARYSAAPYNVTYWEIGNEVDVSPEMAKPDDVYGCWGNSSQTYYGGEEYANLLKVVYPAMKRANPAVQVQVGGLLLDCPITPGMPNCDMSTFMEGVLRAGGAGSFDGIGFHSYDFYSGLPGEYGDSRWNASWKTSGPAAVQKIAFLQALLKRYAVVGKYLMLSETSVLCWSCASPVEAHEQTKAMYVPQMFAYAHAYNLRATIWYSFHSAWQQSQLVDSRGNPLHVYTAMQVLQRKMAGATYIGAILFDELQNNQARGYKFRANGREVWLMWGLSQSDVLVTLPAHPSAISDALGKVQPAKRAFTLTPMPLYVEW